MWVPGGDVVYLDEVEHKPGGDALADGVYKEVAHGKEVQGRLRQDVLHQRLHQVRLLLLPVLLLAGAFHVCRHGLIPGLLRRVLQTGKGSKGQWEGGVSLGEEGENGAATRQPAAVAAAAASVGEGSSAPS